MIKDRVTQDSLTLVKTGIAQLRLHASKVKEDDHSVDRVIREADLLSQLLKGLEPYLDTQEAKEERAQNRDKIDMVALTRALQNVQGMISDAKS